MKMAVLLAENILVPLGSTGFQNMIYGHELGITLMIYNEDRDDLTKIIKSLIFGCIDYWNQQNRQTQNKRAKVPIFWYVLGNFMSFSVREYDNWKRSCKSRKKSNNNRSRARRHKSRNWILKPEISMYQICQSFQFCFIL